MPAMHYSSCMTAVIHECVTGEEDSLAGHLDECDDVNYFKDGWWRWFFAAVRCDCACHELVVDPDVVARAGRQELMRFLMLLIIPFVAGWSIVAVMT